MSSETELSKKIKDKLLSLGFVLFRVQSGSKKVGGYWMQFAPKGTPDIVGYDPRDGKFIGLEVKDEAKVSPEQQAFIDAAERCGCKVGIVRNVEDALRVVGFALPESKAKAKASARQ